jgi:hypothetical protein
MGYGPPQGGYPQQGYYAPQGMPPQPQPKRGMSGGMIALIVIGCMFGGCVMLGAIGAATKTDQPQATSRATAARPTQPKINAKTVPVPVTATQLFSDYQANEVSADEKYKGKTLLVSGSVSDIKKDFTDNVIVHLRTANQFMPVDARLEDAEKGKASQLSKGGSVTLRCAGNGMVIGRPQLRDCTFE